MQTRAVTPSGDRGGSDDAHNYDDGDHSAAGAGMGKSQFWELPYSGERCRYGTDGFAADAEPPSKRLRGPMLVHEMQRQFAAARAATEAAATLPGSAGPPSATGPPPQSICFKRHHWSAKFDPVWLLLGKI